jgi:hypothetical protein
LYSSRKSKLPKHITHRAVSVSVPVEMYFALLCEAERHGASMGEIILGIAWDKLSRLPRGPAGESQN